MHNAGGGPPGAINLDAFLTQVIFIFVFFLIYNFFVFDSF
jgi:hypothetical protein